MDGKLIDKGEVPEFRLRGKAALRSVQVKQEQSLLLRLYNAYIYTLRLPLPVFFVIMFSTPLVLSVVFTAFYLWDVDGLFIPEDRDWGRRSWWDNVYGFAGETHFKVFVFSLSLCTTFGGTGVEARSPYNLLLANLNTLTAQLIFVFLSGAVFYRLSQPAEPIRWAKMALITDDKFSEHAKKMGEEPHKSFIIRVNLADPKKNVLIECKFEVIYRCILTLPGQQSPFITHISLKLVRPEVSYLRFGLIIRHVIDESSPLYGMDYETFKAKDASFTVTVSGTERSSMQPVFSENLYAVADGDVFWDRQYEDQILVDKHGRTVFSANVLNSLKPLDENISKSRHDKPRPRRSSTSVL
ncbi:hypothetical protein KC19_12G055900 [Ceratodon purpureus]|uniref:Inward rectifier potassium channel C-terminal domain-containing protein n=1 Tax=Ceratodon purpureus TaxID=3225 RepID=A0A8T0G6B4_CERPU|nr:hypothetical protein KC19_12G055900 [Ceratodon purpureus]